VLDLLTALLPSGWSTAGAQENIRRSCITITELADSRGTEGLSFRAAHEIAAAVARAVVAIDGDLPRDGYAPFVTAFQQHVGRAPALAGQDFATAVSPEHFVAVRERFGGPGPQALGAALAGYRAKLQSAEASAKDIAARETAARQELDAAFAALAP
jgi:argininosuccinate lyase